MTQKHAVVMVGGYRPEMFGIGRYVPHYVDALAQANWTVEVLAPYPYYPGWKLNRSIAPISEESNGRVRVIRYAPYVPARQSTATRALHEFSIGWRAVSGLVGRIRRAHLVMTASPPLMGAATAIWLSRCTRRPSILLAYDVVSDLASDAFGLGEGMSARLLRSLEAGVYGGASGVIALSDEMARRIQTLSGRVEEAVVIRTWADDALLSLDTRRAAAVFRAREGIPPGRRIIGFAGNFGQKQRLGEVARAAALLGDGFTTIFVGDGPERGTLERLAAEGGRDLRILPAQPEAALHEFLSACDVAIVVAWTGRPGSLFPSKVANALAAGVPIVAITAPGTELAALVQAERIGDVCSCLDPETIAATLRRVADGSGGPEQRGRRRAYARLHFDRRAAMGRFLECVEQTLTKHPSGRPVANGPR